MDSLRIQIILNHGRIILLFLKAQNNIQELNTNIAVDAVNFKEMIIGEI